MRLYERFGERGYHTSIISTFGIDFDVYENVVLSRLRGAGCHNNILLCDGALLGQSLANVATQPRSAGRLYTVNGKRAAGAFHPKLIIQLGRDGGRIIVSSANMTATGLAGNVELAGEFACGVDDSGEQRLIAQAWSYVMRHCDRTGQALDAQISWAETRTGWLRRAQAAAGPVVLKDGTTAALLTTGQRTGIAERFLAQINSRSVERLVVISPYWDDGLKALDYLAKTLSPAKIDLLVDSETKLFPVKALKKFANVRLFDRKGFRKSRFLHAKAFIAQTEDADHVLYGSANCTVAALGLKDVGSINEEVSIYQRFPAGTAFEALELDGLLDLSSEINPTQLTESEHVDDVDLEQWHSDFPGRFECNYELLVWTPPDGIEPDSVIVILLDHEGNKLPHTLKSAGRKGNARHYRLTDSSDRPAFAKLRRADGTQSAVAIVTLIDKIRETAKEARSRQAENATSQLFEETEVTLLLLEILDQLEVAESAHNGARSEATMVVHRKLAAGEDSSLHADHRTLPYEQFVAGRAPREQDLTIPRSSFGSSDVSLVRGFLNRILQLGNEEHRTIEDERALDKAFDLGDETSNAEEDIGRGTGISIDDDTSPELRAREEKHRKKARTKATRDQIANAVLAFNARILKSKSNNGLTTIDILRLRSLLTVIAAAGWAGCDAGEENILAKTSVQVLPVGDSNESWPRLIGRVLFSFFGGADPAIRHVAIDASHKQFTDDLVECWATCFWCLHACLCAPYSKTEHTALQPYLLKLSERVYRLTGFRDNEEVQSPDIALVMERLSERLSAPLGVDPLLLADSHKVLAQSIFEPRELGSAGFGKKTGTAARPK
ncbi:hypothetical protein AB7783_20055 [Tardiphaga sp. 172_B4_N1_3]|uniref:phospholipase D family protein n=1 Tax=Tardiphaga sp. 172_B4_N1_3 TaxID=3240787 RepID=UPI003F8911EB